MSMSRFHAANSVIRLCERTTLDEIPSRREVGRPMNERHRTTHGSKRERVKDGTVPTAEDRHRQPGESGQMRLDQIGHASAE